jgi:predicted alternative tryptophan synthase beta-subunit
MESDVYSLAIVLSELLSLSLFGEDADKIVPSAWYNQLVHEHVRPKLPADVTPALSNAVRQAWSTEKQLRIMSRELLEVLERVIGDLSE